MRIFENWLSTMKNSIASYDYYVDFTKVYENVSNIEVELNILNSLIGKQNISEKFITLLTEYPQCLKCVPILLAIRQSEIYAGEKGEYLYNFKKMSLSVEQYAIFMEKTGLFELLEKHIVSNLVDYVTGIETGLDSNGRKNRGGHLMEHLVENYIIKSGFIKEKDYFKEMYLSDIEKKWGINLSTLSNNGKAEKRFDFVIKGKSGIIYGIETNFYSGGGSKLNETARSYKTLALESKELDYFKFIWITDGKLGWISARKNLEETFDVLEDIYNIADLENGVLSEKIM